MILLALGSNLGDRADYLHRARHALEAGGVQILRASSMIETPALLPENAPLEWSIAFLNQVLQVETALDPLGLLIATQSVEAALGRQDRGRWGPREIDIDVLAYHDVIRADAPLLLPHPQMHVRDFVLRPLAEIVPQWCYPGRSEHAGKTAQQLLHALKASA